MDDTKKTKAQLIAELKKLRGKNAELERAPTNDKNATEIKYNELIQSIIHNSADIIVVQDAEGKYLFYNSPPQYGINSEIVIGKKPHDFFDPDLANQYMKNLKKVIESGKSISSESHVEWSGKIFWFSEQLTPIKNSSGKVKSVVTISRDITELKEAEESIRDSQHMLQTVLDSIPAAVFWKDRDSIYLGGNRTWLEAAGLKSSEKVIGKSDYDLPWEKKQADSFREDDRKVMESGIPEYDIIEPYLRADGTHAWARTNKVPLRDTEGNVIGVLGTYEDITEHKKAEVTIIKLNEELEAKVKLRTTELEIANKELEDFAYSVSHDLRAPLRSISGFAEIITRRHRSDLNEEGKEYFDYIVEASRHMDLLIDDLLKYSRLGHKAVKIQPVRLGELLYDISKKIIKYSIDKDVKIEISEDSPVINSDSTLLNQIFLNLFDNAIKYHRPEITPQILVSFEKSEEVIIISVSDNGIGIPLEFQSKIFNIFQRLHPNDQYPGTGIGLAIVKKVAETLGGHIWIESKIDVGSTFYIELPLK